MVLFWLNRMSDKNSEFFSIFIITVIMAIIYSLLTVFGQAPEESITKLKSENFHNIKITPYQIFSCNQLDKFLQKYP